MRALRFDRYGRPDVLRVEEVAAPTPGAGEAIVRVRAVGLNPLDWKIRAGHVRFVPLFRWPPRGVGCDFAGEIVSVGGGATERHVGERVLGSLLPFGRQGAIAERIPVSYERLVPIPASVDDETAAVLPIAAGTALQALVDHAHVLPNHRVLITGAAGGVGHFAVQIAKHHGAHVTAVCSAANAEFVRALGSDEVIDYEHQDFTQGGARYDAVFDAACVSSFGAASRVLSERGIYLNTAASAGALIGTVAAAARAAVMSRQRAVAIALKNTPAMWLRLLALVEAHALVPRIERSITMEEVADAQRHMETGHGRGKIVVRVSSV